MHKLLFSSVLGIALVFLASLPAWAQAVKSAEQNQSNSHRMVIYNGAVRTIHYFSPGASTAEQNALRDVERSGAEAAEAANLVNQVRDARLQRARTDAARAEFERLQYGYRLPYPVLPNSFEFFETVGTPIADRELLPYLPAYGGLWGLPLARLLAGPALASWYGGWPYGPSAPYGIVPETRLAAKDISEDLKGAEAELARRTHQYDAAVARAAAVSERVREVVGAPDRDGVKPAAAATDADVFQPGSHVAVSRKSGGNGVDGVLVSEDANWITVRAGDGIHKIPLSTVAEIVQKPQGK